MKKNTLLSGLALLSGLSVFATRASAQITIDQSDMPTISTTVVTDSDGVTKPSPGTMGGPQYWDFSTLLKQQAKTVQFMAPGSTQYAADFSPSDNLADSTYGGNGYNFFQTNASFFSAQGAEEIVVADATPFQIEMNLSPDFEQSALPATLGSIVPSSISAGMEQFSKTISFIVTGEKFYDTISYNDTVDAWGTMKMPNGQTYDVLRQKHNEIDYENVYIYIISWNSYERIVTYKTQYDWYAKGVGYILVEMDMDSTSSTVKDIIWDTTAPPPVTTGITIAGSSGGKINAYPNPCNSQVNFSSSNEAEQYLDIFDVTGRLLDKVEMKNGMATLNTGSYSNGVYIYTLTDQTGNQEDRGKFSVQK
jgi:hypothetical protein